MAQYLADLWRQNPVRVCTGLAAAVVFIAAKAGIVLDAQSVGAALLTIVPILIAGETARGHVIPIHKLVTDPKALPPDAVDKP